MEQTSIETLYGAVKSNCLPRKSAGKSYEGPYHHPYLSMATMRVLMSSSGYTDEQIQLELDIQGFTWEKTTDEIADLLSGKNEYLGIKLQLCRNYLRLNHSIQLVIKK